MSSANPVATLDVQHDVYFTTRVADTRCLMVVEVVFVVGLALFTTLCTPDLSGLYLGSVSRLLLTLDICGQDTLD